MATIRDVAERAGVSIATVSNYINGTKPVSPASGRNIQEAIDALHYTQNSSAKYLRQNSTKEIGVILPNLDDPYYVQIFKGIQNAFAASSYFVNLAFSDDLVEQEQKSVSTLLGKQICGLILVSCQPDAWKYYYDRFTSQGKPIVLIDRQIRFLDANCIETDNERVFYELTNALFRSGKKQICLFSGPGSFSCEAACIQGFQKAFSENGIDMCRSCVIETTLTKEHAFTKAIHTLKNYQPDVILTTSDLCAVGITEALNLLGYSKQDVPVYTLGEEHWNCHTQSAAAFSMARPAIKIGDTAAGLLMEQLTSSLRDTQHITLNSQIDFQDICFSDAHETSILCDPQRLKILMLDNLVIHTFAGLIRNFEQSSHIHTEITFLPHHRILSEIQNAANQYDVMMYDLPWLPALANESILSDITEDLTSFDLTAFIPGFMNYFSLFRGRYFGIPFMYAPQMLYYRKDLFDDPVLSAEFERKYSVSLRPPLTMKEYNVVAEFFTKQTKAVDYGISVAASYNECFAPEIHFRLQAFGSQLFDEDGISHFENPQTQALLSVTPGPRKMAPFMVFPVPCASAASSTTRASLKSAVLPKLPQLGKSSLLTARLSKTTAILQSQTVLRIPGSLLNTFPPLLLL